MRVVILIEGTHFLPPPLRTGPPCKKKNKVRKEPSNTVFARRAGLDPASHGFGDRDSAVKLPTHEEQEAEDK